MDGIETEYRQNHNDYLNANKILELIIWQMEWSIANFDTSGPLIMSAGTTLGIIDRCEPRTGVPTFVSAAMTLFPQNKEFQFAFCLLE